ncbi:Myosin_TH1 domain-containing protein [Cephalotus follicularis]|uniref:Myosin_TH1 domain-containing protein n=1 Tax=Cephalotus follicularis TaxID=3775 RepID=A0A1Q3C8T1_CEPFO|nr:Myosin_TH1 domain-containing protein [Cephalotus follicularis]
MDRYKAQRRVQIDDSDPPKYDTVEDEEEEDEKNNGMKSTNSNATEDQEPFMGVKARRIASHHWNYKGDYLDVPSRPHLLKILQKQGDKQVLFADKVMKFTCSRKMKSRIVLITEFAIYFVDPEMDSLKRRIALAAVDKICLSKLSDHLLVAVDN